MDDLSGPGPKERRLYSRLHFKLLGYWPQSVAHERIARHELRNFDHNIRLITDELRRKHGQNP